MQAACQTLLNNWCDQNCPHALEHGSLVALFDTNQRNGVRFGQPLPKNVETVHPTPRPRLQAHQLGDATRARH